MVFKVSSGALNIYHTGKLKTTRSDSVKHRKAAVRRLYLNKHQHKSTLSNKTNFFLYPAPADVVQADYFD